VAYDITRIKAYKSNTFYVPQKIHALGQSAVAFSDKVYLTGVSGNDKFCVFSHPGEKHFEL